MDLCVCVCVSKFRPDVYWNPAARGTSKTEVFQKLATSEAIALVNQLVLVAYLLGPVFFLTFAERIRMQGWSWMEEKPQKFQRLRD